MTFWRLSFLNAPKRTLPESRVPEPGAHNIAKSDRTDGRNKTMMHQRSCGRIPASLLSAAALVLMLILALVFISHKPGSDGPSIQDYLGNMAKKKELLLGMRINLHRSTEAEKSAVMADTDESSQQFADYSRQSADFVERDRRELETLITQDHTDQEMSLFKEFTGCWEELRKIDEVILQFAVQNTNLKAATLSFTEGRKAMDRFEHSLKALIYQSASSDQCGFIAPLASDAMAAGLRIHNLQAPHIVEPRDAKMDEMESEMKDATEIIDSCLETLSHAVSATDRALVDAAKAAYKDFAAVNTKVVRLSRQNSNVKSFDLSLGNKRRVVAHCDETLERLQVAVRSREFKATR